MELNCLFQWIGRDRFRMESRKYFANSVAQCPFLRSLGDLRSATLSIYLSLLLYLWLGLFPAGVQMPTRQAGQFWVLVWKTCPMSWLCPSWFKTVITGRSEKLKLQWDFDWDVSPQIKNQMLLDLFNISAAFNTKFPICLLHLRPGNSRIEPQSPLSSGLMKCRVLQESNLTMKANRITFWLIGRWIYEHYACSQSLWPQKTVATPGFNEGPLFVLWRALPDCSPVFSK